MKADFYKLLEGTEVVTLDHHYNEVIRIVPYMPVTFMEKLKRLSFRIHCGISHNNRLLRKQE